MGQREAVDELPPMSPGPQCKAQILVGETEPLPGTGSRVGRTRGGRAGGMAGTRQGPRAKIQSWT